MKKVDLTTCDDEPIHIPGAIQPHGAMLVMDADRVVLQASANIASFFGVEAETLVGEVLGEDLISAETWLRVVEETADNAHQGWSFRPLPERRFELLAHRVGDSFVVEIEPPASLETFQFAMHAQEAVGRLQDASNVEQLLETAVKEIQRLIGHDRVMAYRFMEDLSGEVVAETRSDAVEESFLGMRYPASDIPQRARDLYALNPVRLIAEVTDDRAELVPAMNPNTGGPLDLSRSVLRAVSPIHIEYLRNMGVNATMSVSLVVGGRLWGLIACHHYSKKVVSHTERSTARLLSRTLSLVIDHLLRQTEQSERKRKGEARESLVRAVEDEGEVLRGLADNHLELLELLDADAVAVTSDSRVAVYGDGPDVAWVSALVDKLGADPEVGLVATPAVHEGREGIEFSEKATGVLAVPFHRAQNGWLLFFRHERVQQVPWAGEPTKTVTVGEHGERLSPRGSFELWNETVRGTSRPWTAIDEDVAGHLSSDLTRLSLQWASARERIRKLALGMVAHDLRNPMQAVSMAGEILTRSSGSEQIGRHIRNSTRRMRDLMTQLSDVTRLQSDEPLELDFEQVDLGALVHDLVNECELAYPGSTYELYLDEVEPIVGDAGRIEQVVANLLSNARHYGATGKPIVVRLSSTPRRALIEVHNQGEPISKDKFPTLFNPYVRGDSDGNSDGMGLGLFIAKSIVDGHGGKITVDSTAEAGTTFVVAFPFDPVAAE